MKKPIIVAAIAMALAGCGRSGIDACVEELEAAAVPAKAATVTASQCAKLSLKEAKDAALQVKQLHPNLKVAVVQDAANAKPSFVVDVLPPVKYGPGLGISYQDLMRDFAEFIPAMKDAPLSSGEQRKMGETDKGKALGILEVVGDIPNNVDRATLTLGFASDSPIHNAGNSALLRLFLRNVFPDWVDAGDRLFDGIEKLSSRKLKPGQKNAAELLHGDKRIVLTMVKELGMVLVTVQHKSAPVD